MGKEFLARNTGHWNVAKWEEEYDDEGFTWSEEPVRDDHGEDEVTFAPPEGDSGKASTPLEGSGENKGAGK